MTSVHILGQDCDSLICYLWRPGFITQPAFTCVWLAIIIKLNFTWTHSLFLYAMATGQQRWLKTDHHTWWVTVNSAWPLGTSDHLGQRQTDQLLAGQQSASWIFIIDPSTAPIETEIVGISIIAAGEAEKGENHAALLDKYSKQSLALSHCQVTVVWPQRPSTQNQEKWRQLLQQ